MGLLQRLFGPSTPPTATASRPSRARRSRKFRGQLESLEPRQMMAADVAPEILLGSVYFEEATGDDSQGDIIEVTFVGGASGTTMNRLVIDGDKRGDGLTDGDVFFDIADGGYGAFKAVGLNILEADGFVIDSISVADGGSQIIFTFSGFDAGETLKFSVDADEMQYRDVDGDSVNSVVEGAEFERSIMTGEFSAVGYVDITLQGLYWDEFDARRTAAQSATGQVLDLPDDRYSDLQDYTDRTAGAVAHAKQIPLATLSGWVYHDRSNDGVFDRGSEEGIGGVTLELLDENGNPTGITTTTSTEPGKVGYYEFRNLHAGKYGVREVQPTGWLDGKDTPGSHGGTAASETAGRVDRITGATLAYGDDGVEYNFGELLVGSIAGRVSASTTADCKFDDPEILLEGVRIDLLDASGNVLATTFTDALGRYKFEGLAPGEYQIREHQPTEYYDGGERVGSAGGTKYDVDDTYSMFSEILLGSGVDAVDYFFCEHVGPSLSGWVYHDRSNDGIFDRGGEEGIGGVVMELLDENGQPTGITTVTSTVAGKVGYYEFTNLAPGKYGVREYHPDGWLDGKDTPGTHGGVAASETAGRVDRITGAMLAFGDIAQEYNFGELLAGSIAGRVSASRDADCHFDDPHILLAGVKIDLLDDKGQVIATTFTNASGEYQFVDLAPGVYEVHEHQPEGYYNGGRRVGSEGGEKTGTDSISQIVIGSDAHGVQYDFCEKIGVKLSGWVYHDRSNDGIFDRGPEEGIGQVTLKLLDANGSDTGRRAVTDPDGYYEFTDLEAGKYTVMEVHPEGWLDGKDTPGNLGGVSQPSPPGDMISEIMINFGQEAVEYNFGELKPGSIRGHVHADYDGDCIADENEPRLASVKIELRDQAGNVIATTYTNANGEYVFENLRPGNYTVFEHQPEGYFQGGNNIGSGGGTKLAQDLLGNINVGSDQHFVDYNFCEKPPAKLSGYVFVDGPPIFAAGGLPDDVWTIRDGTRTSDDRYLAGVTLELRHGVSGDPIMGSEALAGYYGSGPIRIVTDANGYYEFAGLPAGTYAVVQVHPAGLIDGIDTEGTLGGLVVNPVGSPSDTASQGNPSQQSAIQQMREQYGNDIIFRIALTAGQHSQENNFSEIETTFIFIPPDNPLPPKPPVFLNPGQALAQQLYPLLAPVKPEPLLYGGSSGVNGYTWHLSLVNAGYPRSMAATEGLMHLTSTHMSASAWHDVDLGHAVWVFGETDPYGSDDGTTEAIFGHPRGIPVVGDWDGDGTDEIGVFIEGKWYLDLNGNGRWDEGDIMAELGNGGDLPTTGDWDGDGKTDIAIFGPVWAGDPWAIENEPGLPDAANTPGPLSPKAKNMPPETDEATLGHRTLQRTDRGQARRDLIDHVFHYGTAGDQPITGDWNGDGIATIGVFRGGVWYLDMDGDGQFTDADATIDFGIDGTAVVGDWNGDGVDDLGVFADGKWTLDSNGNREVDALDRVFEMGKAGDRPISGDWNGDGVDEPAVYTPAIDEALEREAA